jgi:hypothetical protein
VAHMVGLTESAVGDCLDLYRGDRLCSGASFTARRFIKFVFSMRFQKAALR